MFDLYIPDRNSCAFYYPLFPQGRVRCMKLRFFFPNELLRAVARSEKKLDVAKLFGKRSGRFIIKKH